MANFLSTIRQTANSVKAGRRIYIYIYMQRSLLLPESKSKTCYDSVCQYYIYYSHIYYVDRKIISHISDIK